MRKISDIPILSKSDHIPQTLIKWKSKSKRYNDKTLHFFIEDRKFNAIWNNPKIYNRAIAKYEAVITPDFSLYLNTPEPQQIWNVYRNRWLGAYWQQKGLTVIPSVSWSNANSFDYCFDGIEPQSVVAISTNTVKKSDFSLNYFFRGLDTLIETISPQKILCYGEKLRKEINRHYPDLFVFYPYQFNFVL